MSRRTILGPAGERAHAQQFTNAQLISCPYNESHKIIPSRVNYHLKKCRRQHPDSALVVCPYHYSHHVPAEELNQHKTTCEFRLNVVRTLIESPEESVSAPVLEVPPIPCEEDWDDSNCGTYDPEKANADKVLLAHGRGLAKNERRIYRENQRIRNSMLMNKDKENGWKKDSP